MYIYFMDAICYIGGVIMGQSPLIQHFLSVMEPILCYQFLVFIITVDTKCIGRRCSLLYLKDDPLHGLFNLSSMLIIIVLSY